MPTRALFTLMLKVSERLVTLNEATSLLDTVLLSKVPNLIFRVFKLALIFKQSSSVIAEQFAPVSRSAYVGHVTPPADTSTGTVGRMAPAPPPTHAARSQLLFPDSAIAFSRCMRS